MAQKNVQISMKVKVFLALYVSGLVHSLQRLLYWWAYLTYSSSEDVYDEFISVEDEFFHLFDHSLLKVRITVGEQISHKVRYFICALFVIVLALLQQSNHTLVYDFTVGLKESIVVLLVFLTEYSLVLLTDFLIIFFIQHRNSLSKDVEYLPHIGYPSIFFQFAENVEDTL